MKIFDRDGKINFVDENNVMLGYDFERSCCENAGWFLADKPQVFYPDIIETDGDFKQPSPLPDLTEWEFDRYYLGRVEGGDFDGGGMLIFRLKKRSGSSVDGPFQYLHLYNDHNGYYAHGFDFTDGEFKIKEGYL